MSDLNTNYWILFSGALILALTGGLHCAGMCGAIAALNKNKQQVFLYQIGRLISYLGLGMGAGHFGHKFYIKIDNTQALISSIIVAFIGLLILFFGKTGNVISLYFFKWLPSRYPLMKHFLLGIANGFLPCHFLYGFLTMSATSRSPLAGALIMFALWLGSTPYLFGFSFLAKKLGLFQKNHRKAALIINTLLFLSLLLNLLAHHFA